LLLIVFVVLMIAAIVLVLPGHRGGTFAHVGVNAGFANASPR